MTKVAVKILNHSFFAEYGLPTYATPESAGMDIRACVPDTVLIPQMRVCPSGIDQQALTLETKRVLIPTGLAMDLNNANAMLMLLPKSGLGHKKGLVLGNLVGVIDSDYQLEMFVSCWNTGNDDIVINRGDFICQAILVPILRAEWDVVEMFDRSVERTGGFGSNGSR